MTTRVKTSFSSYLLHNSSTIGNIFIKLKKYVYLIEKICPKQGQQLWITFFNYLPLRKYPIYTVTPVPFEHLNEISRDCVACQDDISCTKRQLLLTYFINCLPCLTLAGSLFRMIYSTVFLCFLHNFLTIENIFRTLNNNVYLIVAVCRKHGQQLWGRLFKASLA